jgi:YD repeat-containing protein
MKFLVSTLILGSLLSLSGFSQMPRTDRDTDGLRGNVRSVMTERSDAKKTAGKLVESNRRRESEYTYDKSGRRLTWKSYDYGTGDLFDSVIYSYIGSDKVSRYEKVENANKITTISESVIDNPAEVSDPRYDYKFKYKYDKAGNVSEESWYQSNGDLWLRYVYDFKGDKREELVYSADGSIDQKYVYTLNDRGNEIEMSVYDPETNKIEGKETYEYLQYDAKGNWTKRVTYEGNAETKFALRPREVFYRKVVYY